MPESQHEVLARLQKSNTARVLLVSDSHTRTDGITQLLAQIERPDLILHCGDHQDPLEQIEWLTDLPVIGVLGNCDAPFSHEDLPIQRLLNIAGVSIFMTHGHRYDVKHRLDLLFKTAFSTPYQANIVCFGHTHDLLAIEHKQNNHRGWVFNPGSSYPGRHGAEGILLVIVDKQISYQTLIVPLKP
ncbi:MAG: metallophosphoesterase family protein [Eubacteriales bacterium]|nr:metallophosphoesterase family protein [Eubacteriales bacterium]